ncbi:MAG TPA: hypothetical protein PLP42_12600 [Acidobacteriota bacterium]|nr:hypothetical protein [Acidobacteriota bacterium]
MDERNLEMGDELKTAPDLGLFPLWAVGQRVLIDLMNRAARQFVDRYTRADGTLIWRREWLGIDGSDDAYEGFLAFPLLYILGGEEEVHRLARRQWEAITRQFTEYGQIHRDFDACYDWMHHGEASTYIYYLGLADPGHALDRGRALAFASMYIGEDPEAPNWDPERKMIRSPLNGSRGPCFHTTAQDWITHRPILAHYLSPFEDLPGFPSHDLFAAADWNDDEVFATILKFVNERMIPGDVPLNLNATSLVTNAFLYTGEEKYRRWVLDYVHAWRRRTRENNGVIPDNIGPSGKIGERMQGKWWGGYYGWRWPHGARTILESTLIAACNAMLLSSDPGWLDLHRSQLDLLWSLRKEIGGRNCVPCRYGSNGWFDYQPPAPIYYIHLYFMSQNEADLGRINERFPAWTNWQVRPDFSKAGAHPPDGWFAYVNGHNSEFPVQAVEATAHAINQRRKKMQIDDSTPEHRDIHHWQDYNPVLPEALIQMSLGTPGAVYHGGLLHTSVRYFDPAGRRPGLPPGVAGLVERIGSREIILTLANTEAIETRDVLIQAGAFGEHAFSSAQIIRGWADLPTPSGGRHLAIRLKPASCLTLQLGIDRFVHTPTYDFPAFSAPTVPSLMNKLPANIPAESKER